jgi:hypothetical protein
MGAGPSLDGEIAQAKETMESFLTKFAKNYSMLYLVGLAKAAMKEQEKAAKGPKWELLKCPKDPDAPDRKSGHMLKRSKHLKKWNKRFFVVRGNWLVDYWETEEQCKQGKKPRGTMNLSGMTIVRDVNDTFIKRVMDLAKKCNLNVDDLPKPEQLPDFTLEVHHTTRDCILLQCESADEHKAWCDILDDCRWYTRSLNISDDKIHQAVFPTALWRTRWQVGIWAGGTAVAARSSTSPTASTRRLWRPSCPPSTPSSPCRGPSAARSARPSRRTSTPPSLAP